MARHDLDLLLSLLKKPRQKFNELAQGRNRNMAQKSTKILIKAGLVKTEPEDWKQGQALYFSLTPKGRIEAYHQASSNVKKSIKILEETARNLSSQEFNLKEYAEKSEQAIIESTFGKPEQTKRKNLFTVPEMNEKKMHEFLMRQATLYKPINNACVSLHRVRCNLLSSSNPEDLVTVIRGNEVLPLITKENLKGINLRKLAFMPFFQAENSKRHNQG